MSGATIPDRTFYLLYAALVLSTILWGLTAAVYTVQRHLPAERATVDAEISCARKLNACYSAYFHGKRPLHPDGGT